MKKKIVCILNMGDKKYEDMEGEENGDNIIFIGLLYSEVDRCLICFNCLLEKEVGFLESCNYVFCMICIFKWVEILVLCFIDCKFF